MQAIAWRTISPKPPSSYPWIRDTTSAGLRRHQSGPVRPCNTCVGLCSFHPYRSLRDQSQLSVQKRAAHCLQEGRSPVHGFSVAAASAVQSSIRTDRGSGQEAFGGVEVTRLFFLFPREEDVRTLDPDMLLFKKVDLRGVTVTAKGKDVDFVSRFFAPKYGVNEDPVTGFRSLRFSSLTGPGNWGKRTSLPTRSPSGAGIVLRRPGGPRHHLGAGSQLPARVITI